MRPHYKFWPRRLPKSITLPSTSLWDNLAISARRYPDKAALVFFGRTLSYRQLMEGAERLAARLASLGVLWLPEYMARAAVARGELVELFGGWDIAPMPLYVAYPANRRVGRKLRVFVDWIVELMDGE